MGPIDILSITLSCTWAGLILGASFLAAPAKFGTPSLTREVALDVGRRTFKIQLRIELLAAAALLLLALTGNPSTVGLGIPLFVGLTVLIQFFYLHPALHARAETIIQGQTPPPAMHHQIYIALETIKVTALIGLTLLILLVE